MIKTLWSLDQQFQNKNGSILTHGKIYVYYQGRTALADTYADEDGIALNTNPIILDNNGRAPCYASTMYSYTVVVCDAYGNELFSYDITLHDAIETAEKVFVVGTDGTVQVDTTTLSNGVQYDLSVNTDIIATNYLVENVSANIQDQLDNKKNLQEQKSFSGSQTKTITNITQNENGVISVTYDDIDLQTEVPNVDITSPNGTIDVQSSTDVQTNTKIFSIDVNTPVYHDNTISGAGTVDNPLSISSSINGLQEQINQKLNVSDYVAPVQSDWNQQDSTSLSYINNKPNLALKEDVANKAQTLDTSSTIDYPSSKAVADFVNSSIATNTANFLGTYDVVEDLGLSTSATNSQIATALDNYTFSTTPTNNDYVFAAIDLYLNTGADEYRRFKFNGTVWEYEYTLNNSSFTQAQWDTINSGIDSSDKTNWNNHVSNTNNPHNVTTSQIGAEPAFTVLPISKGGTGYNNAPQAASNLIYNLPTASSNISSDACEIITGDAGHDPNNLSNFYKRPVFALWNYIKDKISSVLGLTASKYNGTADTAVKLPVAYGAFDMQQGYRLLANITAPGAWNDKICTFDVYEKQAGQIDPVGQCGILTVQIRNSSNNSYSYGATYNRSANTNKFDIVARTNDDKSMSLYVYSSGNIYGGLQLVLVSSTGYTANPIGREGITLYNNNSLQSTITGNNVTINKPITYLENDSVTASKVKDNETLPVNITGYASHLRQARGRFTNVQTGYRLMAYLPPADGYKDNLYVFNIYEARDAALLDYGVLKGTLSVSIRNNNGTYQYSSAYAGHSLSDIGFELRVDASTNGVNLYAVKMSAYYSTVIYELLNAYNLNGEELSPSLYDDDTLLGSISGTTITPTYTFLKQSGGTIPLANNNGVGSNTTPVYVDLYGTVQSCDAVIAKNLSSSLSYYGTSGTKFRQVMMSAPLDNTVNVHFECKFSASNYDLYQSGTLQFNAVYSSSSNSITFSKASIINDYGSSNLWKFYLVPNLVDRKVEIYAESIGSSYNSLNLILLFANGESRNYVNGTTYLHTAVNSIPTPNVEVPVRKDVTTNTSVGSNITPVYIDNNGVPQACDNRIHDLTIQMKYIRTYGQINGRKLLCDRQSWTGTAEQPEFTPINPNDLCTWLNRGDVINIDLTMYDWWRDKYPGWIVEAQCDVLAGETTGTCTNLRVMRQKIVNQQPTIDFQWGNLITDEDTGNVYMEFQSLY